MRWGDSVRRRNEGDTVVRRDLPVGRSNSRADRASKAAKFTADAVFSADSRLGDLRPDVSTAAANVRPRPEQPGKPHKPKPPEDDLEKRCSELLAKLEKHCPGLLPAGPVPAGEIAEPIEVGNDDLQRLLLTAVGVADKRRRNQVVWELAGSELLVHLQSMRVQVMRGLVLVGLTVETNETGRTEVTVPFAVGQSDQLSGMIVTTEPKPRGPTIIIDRWGEAIIAATWQAVLRVIGTLTARAGVDHLGNPLLPGAVVADHNRLAVIAQAAHEFESIGR